MRPPLPIVDLDDTCDRCPRPPAYAARMKEGDTTVLLLCATHWPNNAVLLIAKAHTVWPITSLPVDPRGELPA